MGPGYIAKTLLIGLMAVVWVTGCGSSEREPSTQGDVRVNEPGDHQKSKKLITGKGQPAKGASFCTSATAKRGRMPGLVEFSARCIGLTKGGPIDLAVVLDPGGGGNRGARIVWHGPTLRVSGGRTGSHDGRCSMEQQALECGAEATGRVEIAGRFGISPVAECTTTVSIVDITVAPCAGNYCESGPVLDQLFSRRPRGCA